MKPQNKRYQASDYAPAGMTKHMFVTVRCRCCGESHRVPLKCSNRFCFVCAAPRLLKIRDQLRHKVYNCRPKEGKYFIMATFTVKNGPNLKERMDFLSRAWKKFLQYPEVKWWLVAGSRSIEITQHPINKTWHPHIHLLAYTRYFDYDRLQFLWERAKGVESKYKYSFECDLIPNDADSVDGAIGYVTNYITKSDFYGDDMDIAANVCKGKRMISFLKVWRIRAYRKPMEKACCKECGAVDFEMVLTTMRTERYPDLRGLSPPLNRKLFECFDDTQFAMLEQQLHRFVVKQKSRVKRARELLANPEANSWNSRRNKDGSLKFKRSRPRTGALDTPTAGHT